MSEISFEDMMKSPSQTGEVSFEDMMKATPQAAKPQAGISFEEMNSNPSIFDYLGEVGKQVAKGGIEGSIATPLRGLAASPPEAFMEPDQMLQEAQGRIERGQDPSMFQNAELGKVTESPFYTAGQAVSAATNRALPDKNILNPVVADVSSGVGSVLGNIGTSLVPVAGLPLTIGDTLLQGQGEAVERAVKAGATDDQTRRAAVLGTAPGATEFVDAMLPQLGTPGKVAGFLKRVGVAVAKGTFIEGGQEGLQQFMQNAIAKGIYNPKQDLTEDVAYNALIGAIVGGGVNPLLHSNHDKPSTAAPTAENLATAIAPPQPTQITSPVELPTTVAGTPTAPIATTPAVSSTEAQLGLPLEAPPAPTVEEMKATTMAPAIVAHIEKNVPPLSVPENAKELGLDQLLHSTTALTPLREEIRSSPGANTARLAKLLGPKLYGDPSDITKVSVKEMFQNAFDAIKGTLEKGHMDQGNIDINLDPDKQTISVVDDGSGMTPEVLGKQFLEIAGTNKETKRASGGLGIAKMLFIFGNKALRVTTMRDGKVSTLNTTGEELFSALDDQSKAPKIQIRSATSKDIEQFPKGHGTRIEVVVPQQFADSSTGEMKDIGFDTWWGSHPVLRNSPLFDNINVKVNGKPLEMGTRFPLENYTQFANVKFDWGTARIYVTKEADSGAKYTSNLHVLSNGLWQFSKSIKQNPNELYGNNVHRFFYVDVNPKVAPEDAGYPFDLNRQEFSPSQRKSFEDIFKYISLLYKQVDFQNSAANFGSMQFLDYDPATKSVKGSSNVKIEPKAPPPPNAATMIKPGDKVSVQDGQLIVNGRAIPELTPEELKKFELNPDQLRVDQSEIDPNRVILHDNVDVKVSEVETRAITEYGREKFGKRFDEYVFAIGNAFKELRDIVVKGMPKGPPRDPLQQVPFGMKILEPETNGYEDLAKEGIGISFDREYRGVSIRVPFSGMFLNPFVPEYTDPLRAAVGMVGTMIHELAHHKVRSHDAEFPAEMQRIIIMLDVHPTFNLHQFKQKVINVVAAYDDVFQHMNGVFTSGNFDIQARGKRFEDSSSQQTGDGSLSSDVTRPGGQPESGAKLSDWVAASQTVPPSEPGRGGSLIQTGPSRSTRPADNGRGSNYSALKSIDSGITAPPQQPEIMPIKQGLSNVLGSLPPTVKEAAAHADRMNWFYKFFAGLLELQTANPLFAPLQKYVERVRAMHADETGIHDAAMRIMKDWRSLGEQAGNLSKFIQDLQTMPYLTSGQRRLQLWRHPTQQEFNDLVTKHKLLDGAVQLYNRIRQMDETFLRLIEQNAVDQAQRQITDPIKLADRIDDIRAYGRLARAQPFFPYTRFGRYYASVKDAAGKVTHFETFEPKKAFGITVKSAERYQQARKKELERQNPNSVVTTGVLPETAGPLIGMPTLLLQQMQGEDIGLTPDQISIIQQLQGMRNPAMTLGKRAIYGPEATPGYSLDLQRSFARYYFHGGRYYAKVRHAWGLRGNIAEAQLSSGNKAGLIASYMDDHLHNTVLDARGDFGFFKGAIFLWAMGYVPAAATQNLTQTPMITLPFLAGKFGDVSATRHILKAMSQLTSFYKRGKYDNMGGFEFDALSYGIKTGRISETQAPELAGIATGNNLITGQGGTRFQRNVVAFQEKAAFMFEMAEQFNRRIAFRAALNLALEKPNAKFVDESVQKYSKEFEALKGQFNEAQARAIISAVAATEQTQYVYARYARPRFMRGPKSILFVFKRYMQSTLFMLGQNKADVLPRYLVIAMLMGGLGGVPGYDDLAPIIRSFARWFFGKDVSVDRLVREYVMQWFDGKVEPDLVLHGLARRGFGLPGLLDLMGSFFTGNPGRGLSARPASNIPFPIIDRSKALSMGNILPVDLGKMFEPTNDLNKTEADQAQKASGAVFSVGFNLYKALMDAHMQKTDVKTWEKAMPRALADVSRNYRALSEGRERGRGGPASAATIVSYDPRDTEQMMEAFALLGGYQPLRQQAKWDQIMAKAEVESFYDFTRKGLMEQYFEARKGGNAGEITKVRDEIVQFNKTLPEYARGMVITADGLLKSMQGHERQLQARERGTSTQKSKIPIDRYVNSLFPEATIDVRRVK